MKTQVFLLLLALIASALASEAGRCKSLCKLMGKKDKNFCFDQCLQILPELGVETLSDTFSGKNMITTAALNMRSGPCTNKAVVKLLPANTPVSFGGKVASGCGHKWYSVTAAGKSGWVASEFVKDASTPHPQPHPPAPTAQTLYATTTLHVRTGPCTSNGVKHTLQAGNAVTYHGVAKAGCGHTWKQIKGSFGEGWAAQEFLSANKPHPQPQPPAPTPGGHSCRNFPLFKQCDGRWGGNTLGSGCTICRVGCLMSSVSMAMAGLGKRIDGQAVTPAVLNHFLRGHGGYSGCNYMWGTIGRYGFAYQGQFTNKAALKQDVCKSNKVVILAVHNYGHWVLARGHDAGGFYVNDPGYNKDYYHDYEVAAGAVYNV